MGKRFKVTLTFEYDSEESTEDWAGEMPHKHIQSKQQAIDTARAELESNSPAEFEFDVEEY